MADNPVLLTLTNLCAGLEPFEVDIWSIFNLTVKSSKITNIDLQGLDLALENRWHCFVEGDKKERYPGSNLETIFNITGGGINTHSNNPG